MKNLQSIFSPAIVVVAIVVAMPLDLIGQVLPQQMEMPFGETFLGNIKPNYHDLNHPNVGDGFYTNRSIYSVNYYSFGTSLEVKWSPPTGSDIIGVFPKLSGKNFLGKSDLQFAVTADGHVYELEWSSDAYGFTVKSTTAVGYPGGTPISKIQGDDLYSVMSDGSVFVTHNDTTWDMDTSGLGGAYAYDAALDSLQNVYLATNKGIYQQALSERVWHSVKSGYFSFIYASRQSQIFAGSSGSLMMSSDLGQTWTADNSGLANSATVKKMTDDTLGTVYAIAFDYFNGDHIWQQKNGSAWTQMDTGASLSADPIAPYLNDIAVDSGIFIATNFGAFHSMDGVHWTSLNQGVAASNIYSFLELPSGRKITTTSLGLFTKDPSDTEWTKRFPVNSYLSQIPIAEDNSGVLYAYGVSREAANGYAAPRDLYFSTDHGTTWLPDTAGNTELSSGLEFVDEGGIQHLATNAGSLVLYSRTVGAQWQVDTVGLTPENLDGASIFTSDRHGNIYLGITNTTNGNRLLKRPISGGAWSEVSLNPLIGLPYSFTATKDGKLVGGNNNTAVGYYDGTSWTVIPNPLGLNNPSGYPQSVDSSGRLWVIYGNVDQNSYYTPYGVYWTSDLGQHWTQAADGSINFSSLVSFGDTTYGLNSGNGLWYFVPGNAGVSEPETPSIYVAIMPNPTTGNVTIEASGAQKLTAEVYDELGNLVATLDGDSQANWNGRNSVGMAVSAGIYIVRISGADMHGNKFVISKKLVIE